VICNKEAETLTLPLANKRAKSLSGVAILKKGGRGGKASRGGRKAVKKETIKKEVKEEEDVKIEEDIKDNSNNFLKANNILYCKRKNHFNFIYPLN
jgi:hypothetical protein